MALHPWKAIAAHVGERSWKKVRAWYLRRGRMEPGLCPVCEEADSNLSYEEDGNYASFSAKGQGAIVLEDTLDELGVDLDVWRINKWKFKKWGMGAKVKEGHLVWDDGKIIDGQLTYKGLKGKTLWSISGELIKIEPEP